MGRNVERVPPAGPGSREPSVNRRGLIPTIGVQCGPSVPAHKPFIDILKMPMRVGGSKLGADVGQSSRPIYTYCDELARAVGEYGLGGGRNNWRARVKLF